jgi:thiamine biosynthesis lipoprotein ApbE
VLLVAPRGARLRAGLRGATIIAADCMTADALTKPCLLEPERATELAARFAAHVLVW